MYTRCPHCDTVFRVTPKQLQTSSGQVRCGRCRSVFDAFTALSSQLPSLPASTQRTATVDALSAASATAQVAVAGAVPAQSNEPAHAQSLASQTESSRGPEPEILTLPEELFDSHTLPDRQRRQWLWSSAALALVFMLQLLWFFPTATAQRVPSLRPLIADYCAWTGCDLGLPRLPEQLFIEASDLQQLDPARPNEVLLTVTMRNRARLAQEFPLLELTLTDGSSRAIGRKVFAPQDYLERGEAGAGGFRANEEITLKLYLTTGQIKPVGYRLYLFFA